VSEWGELLKSAVLWGPGLVILGAVYSLIRRPPDFIGKFIAAQEGQAAAMAQMATAVQEATRRDNAKLEEILVGVQLVLQRQDQLEDTVDRRLARGSG
jgi:hypothetical protein